MGLLQYHSFSLQVFSLQENWKLFFTIVRVFFVVAGRFSPMQWHIIGGSAAHASPRAAAGTPLRESTVHAPEANAVRGGNANTLTGRLDTVLTVIRWEKRKSYLGIGERCDLLK